MHSLPTIAARCPRSAEDSLWDLPIEDQVDFYLAWSVDGGQKEYVGLHSVGSFRGPLTSSCNRSPATSRVGLETDRIELTLQPIQQALQTGRASAESGAKNSGEAMQEQLAIKPRVGSRVAKQC